VRLWELPPPTRQPAELDFLDPPDFRRITVTQSAEHKLVARILADL
jgi:hypothetical protein